MRITIDEAKLEDVEELQKLYFIVYGRSYPIAYGNDPEFAEKAIVSDGCWWLVARDKARGVIAGSVVFEIDRVNKVGKLLALVVHPDYRKAGIASRLSNYGDKLIAPDGPLNSVYATARTQSIGPQVIFLREGYLPLGIFPNAHRLKRFETTTFFAKYKEGVLERRAKTEKIPRKLLPLYEVVKRKYPELDIPVSASLPESYIIKHSPWDLTFEAIYAPHYVERRFHEQVTDPADQFYPFHVPNLLVAETSGKVEVFANFNKQDGYCAIVSCNQPIYALHDSLPSLLETLRSQGVSYVEVLIGADRFESLEVLLRAQFLPSALYPAMREENGVTHDFVIMTRTMEPLDFRGMAVEQSLKPFVDQYVMLWKQMHWDVLEVFNDYK